MHFANRLEKTRVSILAMHRRVGLFLVYAAVATASGSPAPPPTNSPPTRSSPFLPPETLRLDGGRIPYSLATGDFDGDGNLDLVVGSDPPGDVTVFLGNGRGDLRRGESVACGPQPIEIAVADFNGDGLPDLAIAQHGMSLVTILDGAGHGRFRRHPGSALAVRSKPHPHSIAACDVDGDGILDLVIDSWEENRFTLLRGLGKGRFSTPGTSIEAGRKPYRNLRLADLNGDGRCDLVAPNLAENTITVLLGDGRGGFPGADRATPAGPAPFSVAVGDLDRNGSPDLAIANYSGHVSDRSGDGLTFLLNDGRGRFRLGPLIGAGHAPVDVAIGDVDEDGYNDAVTANLGSRDITIAFGGPGGLSPQRTLSIPTGGRAQRVLLADFNRDGKADAVVANTEDGSIAIFRSR